MTSKKNKQHPNSHISGIKATYIDAIHATILANGIVYFFRNGQVLLAI